MLPCQGTVAIMASRDAGTGGYRALSGARKRPRPHAARHPLSRYLPVWALAGSGMCHRHTLGCGSPGA
jgi:hypothetical protein